MALMDATHETRARPDVVGLWAIRRTRPGCGHCGPCSPHCHKTIHRNKDKLDGLAITIVHRSNFDDRLARVLCAPDSDVSAVSGIVRDESAEHRALVEAMLREAAAAVAKL